MRPNICRAGICVVILCVLCGYARSAKAQPPPNAKGFYIINTWDDDFYPYWQATITQVQESRAGVLVRHIYVESATQPCAEPDVKAAEKFIPSATIQSLTSPLDLCALNSQKINSDARIHPSKLQPFLTLRTGVVASCGATEKVFKLPEFQMNRASLRRRAPAVLDLSNLQQTVLAKAFGSKNLDKLISQSLGADRVPELKSDKFKLGFWFCFRGEHPAIPAAVQTSVNPTFGADCDWGKFQNVLASYKHPAEGIYNRTAQLANAADYKFLKYVPAKYSPIWVLARIQGKVDLDLTIDKHTGNVTDVAFIDGSQLLAARAEDAVKQWQFDPHQVVRNPVRVTFDFTVKCGE
jgi:hypothetical protein